MTGAFAGAIVRALPAAGLVAAGAFAGAGLRLANGTLLATGPRTASMSETLFKVTEIMGFMLS